MATTFFVLAALVAVANAGILSPPGYYSAPVAYHAPTVAYHAPTVAYHAPAIAKPVVVAKPAEEPFDPNPSYTFSYEVKDATTGDDKYQTESLENGVVKGSYSLVDPDGFRRTVEYTADDVNGFNAVVNREPLAPAPVAVAKPVYAVAKPVYTAAPVYHAPLAFHAPVQKVFTAPVHKVVSHPVTYTSYPALKKVIHY